MKKKLVLLIPGLLFAISSFAQETAQAEKSFKDDPFNHPMLPYYLVFVLLLISMVLVAVVGIYALKLVKILTGQVKKEKAKQPGVTDITSPGWWQRFTQRVNASVPVEQEKNIELDHSYDGIKELDNHLPPWWKWLFYGTIGWAVVYVFVFHFSNIMPLSQEEYQSEIALAEEQARQRKASQPATETIDESKLAFTSDPIIIEKGKNVFANNPCGSCHRNDGGGNTIGPNLTDEYWIHGGDAESVFNTIKNGAVDKGMPAWGKAMSPQDLRDVTFYILSLQGSKLPDAKAPQGELFKQANSLKTDSTSTQASL
jgi:cytochrome c oxidase cbb3-type subunit III